MNDNLSPAVAALAVLACLAAAAPAAAQPVPLPGLEGPALVVFDADAVPHICSGRDHDTFFLQGYLHARDRFFQMDTLRRTFSGTLAELLGEAALSSDVQFRTFGLRRAAAESLAAYELLAGRDGSQAFAPLHAYVDGVNAYLAAHPLPPEYAALELTAAGVQPWTVLDSLTVGKGLAFGLSFDLLELDLTPNLLAYAAAGQALGFNGVALFFEDTHRTAPFDPAVSIPKAATAARAAAPPAMSAPDPRAAALAARYRETIAAIPELAPTLRGRDRAGSNWWLLAGSRTASGRPMLANDPHLALDVPANFYENQLLVSPLFPDCGIPLDEASGSSTAAATTTALRFAPPSPKTDSGAPAPNSTADAAFAEPSLNASGVSFAGVPGLVQGCTPRFCWGSTVNPMDVTDVYQEQLVLDPGSGLPVATVFDGASEPLTLIPQTYRFNQVGNGTADDLAVAPIGPLAGGVTLVVPRRNQGPIVAVDASSLPVTALSVQYTGWRATLELEAFLRWLRAGSLDDFVNALQYFDVGSQNFAYADVDGTIAYFTSAEMPLREDLQDLGFPDGGVPPYLIRDGTHTLHHEWLPLGKTSPPQSLAYEILPFAEMPQVVNPSTGYVLNANNDPVGTSLDNNPLNQLRPGGGIFYLSPGYSSLRMGRIQRLVEALLAGGHKATPEELMAIQANNQLLDAELIAPFVIDAFAHAAALGAPPALATLAADPAVAEAAQRLAAWDFSTPTGIVAGYDPGDAPTALPSPSQAEIAASVAATIFSVWRGQVLRDVIDGTLDPLGLGDYLPDSDLAYTGLAHLLQSFAAGQGFGVSGVDFFGAAPAGLGREQARDHALLSSLKGALDLLASDEFAPAFGGSTDQNEYRWGKLHRIVFDHPLGGPFSVPPAGGFQHLAADLHGVARAGGYEAVDASRHSARADGLDDFMFGSGPNRRFVGVLDPAGIEAHEILPGGQSGVLGSPHYADQLGRWLTNDYHRLLLAPEEVGAAAVEVLELVPPGLVPCVPGPTTLCLRGDRFRVTVDWTLANGAMGKGGVVELMPPSLESGLFWFFSLDNWEMLVKVLDGCPVNDHYWVFAAGATNVGWTLTVTDTANNLSWTATNPVGRSSPAITDAAAFATCP